MPRSSAIASAHASAPFTSCCNTLLPGKPVGSGLAVTSASNCNISNPFQSN